MRAEIQQESPLSLDISRVSRDAQLCSPELFTHNGPQGDLLLRAQEWVWSWKAGCVTKTMMREHREGKSWGASGRGVRSHEASKKEESKDHRIAAGHLDSDHPRPLF